MPPVSLARSPVASLRRHRPATSQLCRWKERHPALVHAPGRDRETCRQRAGGPMTQLATAGAPPVPDGVAAGAARRGPSSLQATNVSAWFGSNKVLERVTLTMEPR